jgi:hypothetical protein
MLVCVFGGFVGITTSTETGLKVGAKVGTSGNSELSDDLDPLGSQSKTRRVITITTIMRTNTFTRQSCFQASFAFAASSPAFIPDAICFPDLRAAATAMAFMNVLLLLQV